MKEYKTRIYFAFISILFVSCNYHYQEEIVSSKESYNTFKYVFLNMENKYKLELSNLENILRCNPDIKNKRELELAIHFIKVSESIKQRNIEILKTNSCLDFCYKQQYGLLLEFKNEIKKVLVNISIIENCKIIKKRQDFIYNKKLYLNALDERFFNVINSFLNQSSNFSNNDLQKKLLLDIQLIVDDYYNLLFWHLYSPKLLLYY